MNGEAIMKRIAVGSAAIVSVVAALCLSLPALGQTTVTLSGANSGGSFGGGVADPYSGSVGNNGTSLSNGGLIVCDDFYDHVLLGETWNATALQASQLVIGTNIDDTLFGTTIGLNGYAALASLVTQIIATPNSKPTQQADLSAAIWWITSGGTISAGPPPQYILDGYTLDAAAVTDIKTALAPFGAIGGSSSAASLALGKDTSLWIFTPNPAKGYNPVGGDGEPQEMWTSVPEGGAAVTYLLLAGASCFGAMFYRSRNQFGKHETV